MADTKWMHAHTFTLHGAVPDVFRAWTDPIELQRWFAEHVAIEPRVGGVFRFWGRHTYGVPGERDATGRIVRHEPGAALAFECPFGGVPSRVTIELAPDPKGDAATSQLALQHAFERRLGVPYEEELVDDLWRLTGTKTKVTLIHDGFSRTADIGDYPFGWVWFLSQLKTEAEVRIG